MKVNRRFGVYFSLLMDSGFTIFCRVKFKFLFDKFKTDLACLASFAAVVCGALRDDIKRIEDKGASLKARLSAFEPINGRTY